MTRLIDALCHRHRQYILTTRTWPADCPLSGDTANCLNRLGCPDCGDENLPCHPFNPDRVIAFHEAGHAVMYLTGGATVEYAVLTPGNRSGGHVHVGGTMSGDAFLACAWGGVAATLHWLDRERILGEAAVVDMIAVGFSDMADIREHVPDFDRHDAACVEDLVAGRWDAIERVADRLLACGRLTGDEIADLAGLTGCTR